MSQRRMFSPKIVDSDAFLDMPASSQLLYFHLSMRADDDGFVGNPKKIMRIIGGNDDDLRVLVGKRFILTFESGVIVIKHWKIHNLIRSDRYNETQYLEEKSRLSVKENGAYTELIGNVIPNDNHLEPQVRLGKVRLGKEEEGVADAPTPKEISGNFFANYKNNHTQVVDSIVEKLNLPREFVDRELFKFCAYWMELTPSGKKQRWETEKTFEVHRRLATWFSNSNKFDKRSTVTGRGLA